MSYHTINRKHRHININICIYIVHNMTSFKSFHVSPKFK